MSNKKDTEKMFSDGIVPKKDEVDFMPKVRWSKKKIFIIVGIISIIIVIIIIIIVAAFSFSSTPSSPEEYSPSDQNKTNDPPKQTQESDSKDKEDSKETDNDSFIKQDCTGVCSKPYDILVYNDNTLKAKLKECGYDEGSKLFTFALSAIKRNNIVRACHNAKPLMFNCEILKKSQDYSKYLSQIGVLMHSDSDFRGESLGENLSYLVEDNLTGETPINMCYEEISNYNFNKPGFTSGAGHFTQLVWKNTKEFGIGFYCQRSRCYITGNYYPSGNFGYDDDYAKNVQKLQ